MLLAATLLAGGGCAAPAPAAGVPPASPSAAEPRFGTVDFIEGEPSGPLSALLAFNEAGLPPGRSVTYSVSGDASHVYTCPDGGSEPLTLQVSTILVARANERGEVAATASVGPGPGPGCPGGGAARLTSATYSHFEISDLTHRVQTRVPGTQQRRA